MHSRKMVIVVFGDKIQMVYQSHRGLQTRVDDAASEQRRVEFGDTGEQLRSCRAEPKQNFSQRARVVVASSVCRFLKSAAVSCWLAAR